MRLVYHKLLNRNKQRFKLIRGNDMKPRARAHRDTNKEFKDRFEKLASTDVIKGHLTNQKRSPGDSQTVKGVLKHVIRERIDTNGWIVTVGSDKDKSDYSCTNPQWSTTLPSSTITPTLYVPKEKTEVEISLDKKNKIYTILRVISGNVNPFGLYQDTLTVSINQNEKTNGDVNAEVTMTKETINMVADAIVVQDNNNNQINLIENSNEQSQKIEELQQQNSDLRNRIQIIEQQLNSDNEDDG